MTDPWKNPSNATSALVGFRISNDATWNDAIQFGPLADGTEWTFPAGVTFLMDVKRNRYDASPLLQLTTANGRIVTDSSTLRLIHFNVAIADLQAALPPGDYVYSFIMNDPITTPAQRTQLMHGDVCVGQGPTYP
jgi:hypothetical protein